MTTQVVNTHLLQCVVCTCDVIHKLILTGKNGYYLKFLVNGSMVDYGCYACSAECFQECLRINASANDEEKVNFSCYHIVSAEKVQ